MNKNSIRPLIFPITVILAMVLFAFAEFVTSNQIIFWACLVLACVIPIWGVRLSASDADHAERTKRFIAWAYFGVIALFAAYSNAQPFLDAAHQTIAWLPKITLPVISPWVVNSIILVGIGLSPLVLWALNRAQTLPSVEKRTDAPPNSEVDLNPIKRAAKARVHSFTTIKGDRKANILTRIGFNQGEDVELLAYSAAFQDHTIRSSRPTVYSGLLRSKRRHIRGLRPKPTFAEKATADFHLAEDYIAPFKDLNDPEAAGDPKNEMVKKLMALARKPATTNENSVVIVTGNVGSGKSTVASSFAIKLDALALEEKESSKPNQLAVQFAIIDLEKVTEEAVGDFDQYVRETIEPYICSCIADQTFLNPRSLRDLEQLRRGTNLVLIFDNLDSAYHKFCAGMFLHADDLDEVARTQLYHPLVFKLIRNFLDGEYANIGTMCLFAIREDTVNCFSSNGLDRVTLKPIFQFSSVLAIKEPDGDILRDIISRRLGLAAKICTTSEGRKNLKERRERFDKAAIDLSSLIHVGVTGLRHTMRELSELAVTVKDEALFERILCSSKNLKTYYYVSGKKHYSQIESGITNIFLVNSKYRKAKNPWTPDGTPLFSDYHLKDHPHTYWLKYLILMVIYETRMDRDTIIQLFSSSGRFERGLIELVLFSLSEVDHGRLIKPSITVAENAEVQSLGLEITSRARPLIGEGYFWQLDYLAMVCEDCWLEFPHSLRKVFDPPKGFGHLGLTDDQDFAAEFEDFLLSKTSTVFRFLDLLEVTWDLERKSNPQLFEALRGKGVDRPKFASIRKAILESFREEAACLPFENREFVSKSAQRQATVVKRLFCRWRLNRELRNCYERIGAAEN